MDTFIYMVDSLSCTAETKTTVFQQIKKKQKRKREIHLQRKTRRTETAREKESIEERGECLRDRRVIYKVGNAGA